MRAATNIRAFTLIELLMVLVLAGLLAVAGASQIMSDPRNSREREGRAFLRHLADQIGVYMNQSGPSAPTVPIGDDQTLLNNFRSFAGFRTDLEYYNTTAGPTGLSINVRVNGPLATAPADHIIIRPKDPTKARTLTATYNGTTWVITP